MNSPKPNLEDLIISFRRKIMDACRKDDLPFDMPMSQVEVMRFIGPRGKKTMKSIAEHLKITPPSVTSLVADMEKRGAVERQKDPTDRRTVSIVLTKKARDIYESMHKHKQTILEEMLSKLSSTDKKSLERIITTLIKD